MDLVMFFLLHVLSLNSSHLISKIYNMVNAEQLPLYKTHKTFPTRENFPFREFKLCLSSVYGFLTPNAHSLYSIQFRIARTSQLCHRRVAGKTEVEKNLILFHFYAVPSSNYDPHSSSKNAKCYVMSCVINPNEPRNSHNKCKVLLQHPSQKLSISLLVNSTKAL